MGKRSRRHHHHHHESRAGREERLTARQVTMERHRLFVEEFSLTFGPEWTRTLWRAVERRMQDHPGEAEVA